MAHWHGISRRKSSGGRLKRPSSYRGKRRTYVTEVKLEGGKPETVTVGLSDFKNVTDGVLLKSWAELDELGLVAKATIRGAKPVELAANPWQGPQPVFKRLEWILQTSP